MALSGAIGDSRPTQDGKSFVYLENSARARYSVNEDVICVV
jgi:hypothetical protein